MSRPAKSTGGVVLGIVGVGVVAWFSMCAGFVALLEIPFWLAFGWAFYLRRVLPEVQVSGVGVVTALATLAALALGCHLFLRQFYDQRAARPWRARWTAATVGIVVLMFFSGIGIVGATHQLGWLLTQEESWIGRSWDAAERVQSKNNLKQIVLAIHNYHDEFGQFAPGGTFDAAGHALHSWETHLLPYLEQSMLHDQIDLSQPWRSAENAPAFKTRLQTFTNPGLALIDGRSHHEQNSEGLALSHYAANVRVLGPNRALTISEIADGTGNKILSGEIVSHFRAWGDPVNWRDPSLGINTTASGFGGPWEGQGVQFLFCDGTVRFINQAVDLDVLKSLATPHGGETLPGDF